MNRVAEYRELIHRLFVGEATTDELRAKGLPPWVKIRRQARIGFGGADRQLRETHKGEAKPQKV